MLAGFLESRGFSVALLNGSLDLDARTRAQQAFAAGARVLVSTDVGGEGLNLQFCHVVVNFDMPWNPMRVEQRIGRVDRIGQRYIVRAVNFVLNDTVEHRVRQVLEEKLEIIAQEFGVDKAADVMDSVEAEPLFDGLFVQGLSNPEGIERECDAVIAQVKEKIVDAQKNRELLADVHTLEADAARQWRDHPAQFWLERAITNGLLERGGLAVRDGKAWRIRWADGSESARACFDARTAEQNPDLEWVSLEDPRARALVSNLPRCVPGQPLPYVRVSGLPDTVRGVWSLWVVSLCTSDSGISANSPLENFNRKRFLPVFVAEDGRSFVPTAKRIWDLLLTEPVTLLDSADGEESARGFDFSLVAARNQGERLFTEMLNEHQTRMKEERDRAQYAFDARYQAIGRIGLPAVREHRRKRLQQEHHSRLAAIEDAEVSLPDLTAVMILRIGDWVGR